MTDLSLDKGSLPAARQLASAMRDGTEKTFSVMRELLLDRVEHSLTTYVLSFYVERSKKRLKKLSLSLSIVMLLSVVLLFKTASPVILFLLGGLTVLCMSVFFFSSKTAASLNGVNEDSVESGGASVKEELVECLIIIEDLDTDVAVSTVEGFLKDGDFKVSGVRFWRELDVNESKLVASDRKKLHIR